MESTNKFTGTSVQFPHRRGYFFAQRKIVGTWLKCTEDIYSIGRICCCRLLSYIKEGYSDHLYEKQVSIKERYG